MSNWRAFPVSAGELTRLMVPLEVAPVAGSCSFAQLLSCSRFFTLTASEGIRELTGEVESVMSTATLAVQVAPPLPHAVRCTVCVPVAAETSVESEAPLAMVGLEALSSA